MSLPIVILGSGLAGFTLAREFRKLDLATPLVIVSRDAAGFYSKPMLSNALAGKKTAATLVMKPAEQMAADLKATVRARSTVRHIDVAAATVEFDDGQTLAYRDLVLALGADPIRLPLAGDAADTVLSVNDLDDYARFAERLESARSVLILGAGLIGCEFANDLLARGIAPTVVDLAAWPLSRLLPPEAGQRLHDKLAGAGAVFRFGVAVSRVPRYEFVTLAGALGLIDATPQSLLLADATALPTMSAKRVFGIGDPLLIGRRAGELAAEAGIATAHGVVTDRLLATSAPHVHALGDCAEVQGHHLPYVLPIMQQARALAATLAGTPTPVVYPAMPVTVKTPACPTVVCPPPLGASGEWKVDLSDAGCDARFESADGQLLGFALLGASTSLRQALGARVAGLVH